MLHIFSAPDQAYIARHLVRHVRLLILKLIQEAIRLQARAPTDVVIEKGTGGFFCDSCHPE